MSSNLHAYEISDNKNDHGSTESLLKQHDEPLELYNETPLTRRKLTFSSALILHVTAIVLYGSIALLITYHMNLRSKHGQSLIYSPANDILDYKTQIYDASLRGDPDYFGEPGDYVDGNWHELLKPSTIHITEAERQNFDHDLPIVRMADGTYLGQIWVYHELHCLKRLYQYINSDYYFPNLTERQREMNKQHNEHCFGTLRQAVMCHGDVAVMSMVWGKHSAVPLGDFSNPHQCVNFEKLHTWALNRAVTDGFEPGVLVHPKLGPSFPDGQGTKIGFDDTDVDEDGHVITDD